MSPINYDLSLKCAVSYTPHRRGLGEQCHGVGVEACVTGHGRAVLRAPVRSVCTLPLTQTNVTHIYIQYFTYTYHTQYFTTLHYRRAVCYSIFLCEKAQVHPLPALRPLPREGRACTTTLE